MTKANSGNRYTYLDFCNCLLLWQNHHHQSIHKLFLLIQIFTMVLTIDYRHKSVTTHPKSYYWFLQCQGHSKNKDSLCCTVILSYVYSLTGENNSEIHQWMEFCFGVEKTTKLRPLGLTRGGGWWSLPSIFFFSYFYLPQCLWSK